VTTTVTYWRPGATCYIKDPFTPPETHETAHVEWTHVNTPTDPSCSLLSIVLYGSLVTYTQGLRKKAHVYFCDNFGKSGLIFIIFHW